MLVGNINVFVRPYRILPNGVDQHPQAIQRAVAAADGPSTVESDRPNAAKFFGRIVEL